VYDTLWTLFRFPPSDRQAMVKIALSLDRRRLVPSPGLMTAALASRLRVSSFRVVAVLVGTVAGPV
jgi:hypothetical protein